MSVPVLHPLFTIKFFLFFIQVFYSSDIKLSYQIQVDSFTYHMGIINIFISLEDKSKISK